MVDIATRVWNHKWKIDPIVRSLIDTDFYKLLMCQSVFRNKPDTQVVFSLINRTGEIRLADLVDEVWDAHNPDLELAGVVVNKVPGVSSEADRRYDELTRTVGKRAVWQPVVPHRVIVNQAIGERRPIHAYGSRSADVSEAFDRLWAKLRRVTKD